MSMTREEALASYERLYDYMVGDDDAVRPDYGEFIELSHYIRAALRHQIWEEQLWHDAKTDPPTKPGLYYGKTDDTNPMYACRYRDGVWVLDMYPQTKMDIVQWADYTAFVREDD